MDENHLIGAEKLQEQAILAGVAKCRTQEPMPSGFDGTCGCGEPVPEGRIKLGFYRCLDCQVALEKRRGR